MLMTSERRPRRLVSDTRSWSSGLVRFSVIGIEGHPDKNYIIFEKNLVGGDSTSQRFNLRVHDYARLKALVEQELADKHQWALEECGLQLVEGGELTEQLLRYAEQAPDVVERILDLPNLGNLTAASFEAIDRLALRVYEIQADNLERVLDRLSKAGVDEFAQFSALLDQLQLGQIAVLANLLNQKLRIIDLFERVSTDSESREREVHELIEQNCWIASRDYEIAASDRPLSKYLGQNAPDDPELKKRPDLIVRRIPHRSTVVLIELKRPSVKLRPEHVGQVLAYKSLIRRFEPGVREVECYLFGYEKHPSFAIESADVCVKTYAELISELRDEYHEYMDALDRARQESETLAHDDTEYPADSTPSEEIPF